MKILQGSLRETQYAWPDKDKVQHGETSPLDVTKQTVYGENQVTYMSDKVCLPYPVLSCQAINPPHAEFGLTS